MNRADATVEELAALLPDLDELEFLRLRLVGLAVPDPGRVWEEPKSTFDKRIVTPEAAEQAVDEAEASLHEHVSLVHAGLRPVLRSFFEGRPEESASALIALGEKLEGAGRVQAAGRCYAAALSITLPLVDKGPQILALRRIARVAVTVGNFHEAVAHYDRSAELARDSGALVDEVIALTGLGNVRLWQGRWSEAEQCYQQALERADASDSAPLAVERGQIWNNLGLCTTRQGRMAEAEGWFERAFLQWESVSSPVDLAICHFNRASLREAQERWSEARHDYERALALPIPSSMRAVIATDFAEWFLHEGHVSQAEAWGRVAEEDAIAAASPYMLGHMYKGRGNIARARGDADGFIFFEKALEIAGDKGYAFLEALTRLDYGQFRAELGGTEEAVAHVERAIEIFRELGALGELERAERTLAALGPAAAGIVEFRAPELLPEKPEPPRLAATGD